jgi:hypothetical protein
MRRDGAAWQIAAGNVLRAAFGRFVLAGALAGATMLALAASAFAVSGTPINIGTPFEVGQLQDAVDASGTGYIAWSNTKDLPPTTTNVVQYCVLPAGATSCKYSGTLAPADSGAYIDNVQVLADDATSPATIVILADVYGTSGSSSGDYVPEQEWQSTNGGQAFTIVNGGLSVADGILSADTGPLSAVVVPGTNALGYGWESAASFVTNVGAAPTFDAFPLSSPPECSTVTCPASELYSVLEPDTNPDQVSNGGGQYASQTGTNPGVLGIFATNFSNGPLGCAPGAGTAYAYGSGDQSAGNSYDSSSAAGAGSAWKVLTAQADCNVDNFAVAGGPSGFGVLEYDTAHNTIVYQKLNQTTGSFAGQPYVTIDANQSESDPAVSQDGSGGVYATFLNGGAGDPIALAYSSSGGTTWAGPTTINPNTDAGAGDLTSAVGPNGQGWLTWLDNGSVYAQQFVASDAVPPPAATAGGTATSNGKSVTITISCASTPCTVTITITIDPPAATDARAGAKRKAPKIITLASGTAKLRKLGKDKLAINLTGAGKSLLSKDHGHLAATITLAVKTAHGIVKSSSKLEITAKR